MTVATHELICQQATGALVSLLAQRSQTVIGAHLIEMACEGTQVGGQVGLVGLLPALLEQLLQVDLGKELRLDECHLFGHLLGRDDLQGRKLIE